MILHEGLVVKSTGSRYTVKSGNIFYECRIKGKLRIKGIRTTNPLTVGDIVDFEIQNETSENGLPMGVITNLQQRKNYIIRKSVNLSKESHIIASNIDMAFILATINYPVTMPTFIDRFLVTAEAYSIPSVVVFNKIDLYNEEELLRMEQLADTYRKIGYECLITSTVTGQGIDAFKAMVTGKVSVITGVSGVGKSTLINTIDPALSLKTEKISDSHKSGKHTTTFSEMFELSFGGFIIDTPGIRSFGMIDMENDDVSHYFPEIFEVSHQCRFNNCTHTHEPGCAVREAIELGQISTSRYESYLSILFEDENEKYRLGS
ncbi:MAG: ribosome small subunit-dependent GTPase A [Bacteroidales bacterium]|nr:ribosome small subunit-dependent GTPase A [Bacteroidales bacterium]